MNYVKAAVAFVALTAASLDVYSETYPVTVHRVIDGDTVVIAAEWLPAPLKKELGVRIYGVDTPEKGYRANCNQERELGQAATDFTRQLIRRSSSVNLELKDWDKYGGRVLGDLIVDGQSLRGVLLQQGFARVYYGDRKLSWCH